MLGCFLWNLIYQGLTGSSFLGVVHSQPFTIDKDSTETLTPSCWALPGGVTVGAYQSDRSRCQSGVRVWYWPSVGEREGNDGTDV